MIGAQPPNIGLDILDYAEPRSMNGKSKCLGTTRQQYSRLVPSLLFDGDASRLAGMSHCPEVSLQENERNTPQCQLAPEVRCFILYGS